MHEAGGSNGETNTKNRFTAVRWTGFCLVLTKKTPACSHCSTMVFKINSVDMGTILRHQRLFHLVVRRQFWILNVHCQI